MDTDERKLSKLYRKIVTSDETKAILLYGRLDDELKERVRKRCIQNGSERAIQLLNQIDQQQAMNG
ncbi:hypothetical protein [Desertibacillus haloalkaliphilus]|uniref:hypothetical protein n=1 Tax=Desertibacillus haloalkaliphilus TaxID=1328930 RepID=UPI001C26D280|nr:hypothetical protein [Desertibacillus haloalkaliphilus]MBU8905310.1 hypothetical protein [Desertibacillus haloalkaliphilus]